MARNFPTTSDFISEGSIGSINVTGNNLTVHAWIKGTNNGVIVNRWGSAGSTQQFLVQATSNELQVATSNGIADIASGVTTITDGVWHSVALRKNGNGTGTLEAWVDGVVDGSADSLNGAQSVGSSAGSRYVIGLRSTAATSFGGVIAEVSVWLVTLTTDEMVALSKGASPLMVRPGDLYHYHPVWGVSPEIDLDATKINLNISGTPTRVDHAPVGCPFPVAT
jgi:hypothetical protein